VRCVIRNSFNSYDFLALCPPEQGDAGTHRFAIKVNSACSALGHAASELGTLQANDIPKGPEQWHLRICVNLVLFFIYD
jgi:hypothetical protein